MMIYGMTVHAELLFTWQSSPRDTSWWAPSSFQNPDDLQSIKEIFLYYNLDPNSAVALALLKGSKGRDLVKKYKK